MPVSLFLNDNAKDSEQHNILRGFNAVERFFCHFFPSIFVTFLLEENDCPLHASKKWISRSKIIMKNERVKKPESVRVTLMTQQSRINSFTTSPMWVLSRKMNEPWQQAKNKCFKLKFKQKTFVMFGKKFRRTHDDEFMESLEMSKKWKQSL